MNPYQTAAEAIQQLIRTRTALPPSVSRTLGFQQVAGVPLSPNGSPIPAPGGVTQQASAAGEVLDLLFNTILFGAQKPPVVVATTTALVGTFVPGSGPTPDQFQNVPVTL